jgi:superfamily II DNA or RNA helicase
MTMPPPPTIPEVGQLVDVRQRRFIVTDVMASSLPRDPLALRQAGAHHLVTLTSVEDDALGEEIQIIWEVEIGAQVHETLVLPTPDGFDSPHRLAAFLSAVRWGAVSSADVRALQAPFRSGIEIEDYQLDPVVRAIQMPRVNLLIADDVGLGKTIEAGLVAQELLIRHRARRLLIVCPAALQRQWRDQMREKFGLDFRIVDSDLMRFLRRSRGLHVNPWTHFPRLITSMDYLKRDQPIRLFREALPAQGDVTYPRRFDLLIVDEAHNVAPSGVGRYAVDSQRTAAVRLIAPHFEHRLFLTATPHNGYAESFTALLELLDPQRFARGIPPDRQALMQVMVRRLKSDIPRWDGSPRFPRRELHALDVAYTDAERQVHRWLQAYTRLRQQDHTDHVERTATEFVLKLLKKRLLSSPAAFLATLRQHQQALSEATRPAQRRAVRRPGVGILRSMIDEVDEAYGDDVVYETATDEALHTTTNLFRPLTEEEHALLTQMRQWADQAAHRPDRKAETLLTWLRQYLAPHGQWSDDRVIIFTEYRATQKWLQNLFAAEGIHEGDRLLTLYGGMADDQRERVKAAFQAAPEDSQVRVLLATDAASEGIDLQRHCHRLIHYEIPWNPNRMEQRNGRIDRHGQPHTPHIYHFAPHGYDDEAIDQDAPVGDLEGDLEFLMRAVRKVEQIREDLGKVGPVIADQVTEAMLGTRTRLDTVAAERQAAPVRQMLTFERNLREHIQKLYDQVQESRRTLHLTPEHIQSVVQVALDLAGQPRLEPAELADVWPDPSGQRQTCPVFWLPPLRGSWGACAEGLEHPYTHEVRPITFDHSVAKGRDDVVLVHLNHRLVQMALRLLRAEVWSSAETKKLHRVVAQVIPDRLASTPLVIAHARLVVIGSNQYRLHEELITAGGEINQGRFRRIPQVGRINEVLAAAQMREPAPAVRERLKELWPTLEQSLEQSLKARMDDRLKGLQSLLADREQKEITDITSILRELEQAIRQEVDEPQAIQLELFSDTERDQYSRNVAALQARLAQIPGEIEQETAAIRTRYAEPQPRLFPVAVVFLVPERLVSQ